MTKYLKYPKAKRNDRGIPIKQNQFTRMIRDIPASELPDDAVADSINTLLFGDRFKVRPGISEWSSTTLPTHAVVSSITKTGSSVTFTIDSGETDTSTYYGKYIIYADGSVDQILNVSGSTYTADNNTSRSIQSGVVIGPLNGVHWHKKSQKVFIHIHDKLYYSDYTCTTWTRVWSSVGDLGDSKSTFDEFRDDVYVFNAGGHFKINTSQSPYVMIQINTTPPTNTLQNYNSPNQNVDSSSEETFFYTLGRRYLYSMSRIAGTDEIRDRIGGNKIIKETGLNPADSSNDYVDHKEAFYHKVPGEEVQQEITARYLSLNGTYPRDLAEWVGVVLNWNQAVEEVIDGFGTTTTKLIQADCTDAVTWDDVAQAVTDGLRAAFPEFKYIKCVYIPINELLYLMGGETNVNMGAISAPTTVNGVDATLEEHTHWFASVSDATVESDSAAFNLVGDRTYLGLQIPSASETGWTHFSVYVTKHFSERDERYSLVNKQQFIWAADIRVTAIIKGTISSAGVITVTLGEFEPADSGCFVYLADGTRGYLENIISSSSANSEIHGDGTTEYWMAIGASDIKTATVASNVLTLDAIVSGTTDSSGEDLDDPAKDFIALGVVSGDWVHNETDDTWTQVTRVVRGKQRAGFGGAILIDDNGDFINDGMQIGDTVKNLRTGATTTVLGPINSGSTTLAADILDDHDMFVVYDGTYGVDALHLDSPIMSNFENYAIYRNRFVSDDVGKTIHWYDGSTSIITGYTDRITVTVDTTTKASSAMTEDLLGRNFSDVVMDETLDNRESDWPAIARFWSALPSGELGNVAPGFLTVAERLGEKAYYSQYNFEVIYLVGHYRADYQFLEFKGRLTSIQDVPNQIIFFCQNSTWRTQTNVVNSIDDDRIGDTIAIQSGQSVIDGYIGAVDHNGIVDVGIGQKMLLTSEPGIRLFDGYRYGENLVIDDLGRGLILKDLQQMRHRFCAVYEPNLYGFIFWANTDSDTLSNGNEISKTNVCYRLALRSEQGFGFTEIQGSDWAWSNLGGGPLLVSDGNEENLIIVFDYKTGKPQLLSTRKSSSISTRVMSFLDRSTEIDWSLTLKEHTSDDESKKLHFTEQKFFMRPEEESNQGASGYDANGFRNALTVKLEAFKDGNVSADGEVNANRDSSAIFTNVNQLSTLQTNLSYPYNIEARRVQHKISGTGSEIQCVSYKVLYTEKDVIDPPQNVPKERNLQRQLATPTFWLSRGINKQLNLASGKTADTLGATIGTSSGPDGNSNSAMYLLSSEEYTWESISTKKYFNKYFWLKVLSSGSYEYKETVSGQSFSTLLKIVGTDSDVKIYFNDLLKLTIPLTMSNGYFFILKANESGLQVLIYDFTKALVNSELTLIATRSITRLGLMGGPAAAVQVADTNASYTSDITIKGNLASLFDIRRYDIDSSNDINSDAGVYWIRDIIDREGYSLLPENNS